VEDRVSVAQATGPDKGKGQSRFSRLTRAVVTSVVGVAALNPLLFGTASASNWTVSGTPGSHGEAQSSTPPAAPSGVLAGCGSSRGTIGLAWSSVSHASSYIVLDATTSATGPYSVLASGVTIPLYQTGGMSNNKTYWFEVEAQVGSSWVSARSAASNSVKIASNGSCST
jgi:hypothetical protein